MQTNRRAADQLKLEDKQKKDFQETLSGDTGSPQTTLAEGRPIEESMNSQCSKDGESPTSEKIVFKTTKQARFLEMVSHCPVMEEYYLASTKEVDVDRLREEFAFKSSGEKVMLSFLKIIWNPHSEWFEAIDNFPILRHLSRLDEDNEQLIAQWAAHPYWL